MNIDGNSAYEISFGLIAPKQRSPDVAAAPHAAPFALPARRLRSLRTVRHSRAGSSRPWA